MEGRDVERREEVQKGRGRHVATGWSGSVPRQGVREPTQVPIPSAPGQGHTPSTTSSVCTVNPASGAGPKLVVIAQSVASRP